MSCKLWGKVTSVSVNINFGARMSLFYEKNLYFGGNVDFFIKCALLLKVIIFLQNMLIFSKMWLLVWRFIYINKVSNSEKTFNFLDMLICICVNFHYSISFVGKLLFWFKIWFCSAIFWASVIFLVKSTLHFLNFLGEIEEFFEKAFNLVVNFFKKWQLVLEVF